MFRPMLAANAEPGYELPVYVSPKLDGIRCCILDGEAVSRNLKPIRNAFIQEALRGMPRLDGELIVGEPTGNDVWNRSNSGVMKATGEPDFSFHIFDHIPNSTEPDPFERRLARLTKWFQEQENERLVLVPQTLCTTYGEVDRLEELYVGQMGYEGLMIRTPASPYKLGRSTVKEGFILKLKRFDEDEAAITGVEALNRNTNTATIDALGLTKRSKVKEGLVATELLGKFHARDIKTGVEFDCGSGFTLAQRAEFWRSRPIGQVFTYKHLGWTPDEGKPRHPVFKGIRHADDLPSRATV